MSIAKIMNSLEYGPAPESRAPADAWLAKYNRRFGLFIDGAFCPPESASYFPSHNPADGEALAEIAAASTADVARAVDAAESALPAWRQLGCHGRARYLYAIARQVQKHARLFAVLESLDNGKPIRESRDIDIPLVARHFYHHAGWAQLRDTEFPGHEEVGVVGQIIPWNFPLLMLAWKIAPALAMGNTVVLKPAEFTSLTALLFCEILQESDLPAGVVNIVTGAAETGKAIVDHPNVKKVAFTGSTEVGRILRRQTAGTGKKLSLELGGKSPFIVFDDADLDGAVEGVVDAIYFNQGQVCCAGSRLLVQETVSERFHDKLKARIDKLRVGNPLDKGVDMGAVVDPSQLETIRSLVERGQQDGAQLWQPATPVPQDGCFFPPTLFTDVSPSAFIAQTEIFGPVLVSSEFRTPAEAVELANNTRYGLAASVWTENVNLALDIAPKVKAGVVWVNCTNIFDAAAGFGGYRESGFGREGGREGLYEYLVPKWQKQPRQPALQPQNITPTASPSQHQDLPAIDRTAKLYIGGKQVRPDGGYSLPVVGADGALIGEVPAGNRKDIRNAVEAAHSGSAWTKATGHNRAQVLYYLAENLGARGPEFAERIRSLTGADENTAHREVETALARIYTYAALADKYDGLVHQTPHRNVTLAMPEAIGVLGVVAPTELPLLGFVSTVVPAIAMGNRVVAVPSQQYPLVVTDFYQLLDTSDVPAGTVNIVTGERDSLTKVLADHDAVDGLWYFGSQEGSESVEASSAENMKRTWVNYGLARDWWSAEQGEGREFVRRATETKNIWVPYGE